MSAQGVDLGMITQAQAVYQKFMGMAPPPNVFQVATAAEVTANANQAFPVQIGSTDPEDQKYSIRSNVLSSGTAGQQASGVIPGIGQVIADDKFFDYAARKKEQEVLYDFYRFMLSNAELTSPEKAAWWYGKFPWMRDLRLREIDRQADLQKGLAKIQVTGPENMEDFMLLFLVGNGTIPVPNGPLTSVASYAPYTSTTFQQGFFSPFARPPWSKTPIGDVPNRPLSSAVAGQKVTFTNPVQGNNGANPPWAQPPNRTVPSGITGPANWSGLLGLG